MTEKKYKKFEKEMEERFRLYTVYHKPELLAMKEDGDTSIWYDVNQPMGMNHMNPVYCELVCMHNVWKEGKQSTYVGFCHYSRQLKVTRMPDDGECQIYYIYDFGDSTVYEHFAKCHNIHDMDIILSYLDVKYGEDNPYSSHIMTSHKLISNNCFMMKWEDFDRMMTFLFDILDHFAEAVGCSADSIDGWQEKAMRDFENDYRYQMRLPGFIAERLISAWITTHLKAYR